MRRVEAGSIGWYGAVAAGGVAGASLRWGTGALVGRHTLPLATLAVNVVGCLVLGVVVAVRSSGGPSRGEWVPLGLDVVGVGLCGGLTTFSSFTVEVVDRAADGRVLLAVAYVVLSLVAGGGAFLVGEAAVERRRRRRGGRRPRPGAGGAAGAA